MYNENDKNQYEYHYSYRPNYEEPLPSPEVPQKKPRRKRTWLRVTAGILCGALVIGGSFGAGWFINNWMDNKAKEAQTTTILYTDRAKVELTSVEINGTQKLTYPEIYAANVDSCVSINVSTTAGYNFFGQPVQSASSGSGFVITSDGYIVTNYHVISGATSVEVTFNDGSTYSAQLVGGDADYDIAVIKVDPGENELKPVVIGSSDNLLVGDDVIAIGNPLGELTFSMSEGIVSCLNREINVDGTPFNMIQITSAVNSGNSGGPLFNHYGEVVGIVSAKYSTSSGGASVEGLGFAIPINDVLSMIKDIMENGQVTTRPYMGVKVDDAARYPQTGVTSGAYLAEVTEDGPAAKAGLQAGDVITMIGTTTVTGKADVTDAVGSKSYSAGDTVTITYVREGKVYTTELTFGSTTEMPQEPADSQQSQQGQQGQQYPQGGSGGYPYDAMQDFLERFFSSGF